MVSRLAAIRGGHSYKDSLRPPVGGWNTRDDIADMPRNDAVQLDNWLPDANTMKPRKGYVEFTNSVGSGNVETLAAFFTSSMQNKFVAGGGSSLYDITSGTAVSIGSGYSNDRWDTISFNNHLILVNGVDRPQDYDGTSVSNASFTGYATPERFFAAHVFKNRVLYAAAGELAFWYTELFASTGIVTKFPLAGISERGGSVIGIHSWTVDGGSGPDDFLAIFTSEGEVLVYQGTDPGTDFAIVGRFFVGRIRDNRAISQIYGKLFVATERDYIYLPDQLLTSGGGRDSKLSGAAAEASDLYGTNPGWVTHHSPNEGLMIVNVPTGNSTSDQHVINVKTGAATRFTNMNARSWGEFGGNLYFGGNDGKVYRYTGTSDDGAAISCVCRTAPALLRSNAEKQVVAYRPKFLSKGNVTAETGLAYDFGKDAFKQSSTVTGGGAGGVLPLDWPFNWSSDDEIRSEWLKGAGRGTHVQLFLQATTTIGLSWLGTDYIVESGGNMR